MTDFIIKIGIGMVILVFLAKIGVLKPITQFIKGFLMEASQKVNKASKFASSDLAKHKNQKKARPKISRYEEIV